MVLNPRLFSALRAGSAHFLLTLLVAAVMAGLVFGLWYPWPLYKLVAGRELFWLVVGVDVVCGPLLTMVLWNPSKLRRELIQDLSMVVAVQLAALAYGMHAVAVARPVHLVFEADRLRVVTASEIDSADLPKAPDGLRQLPWTGPTLVSLRDPRDSEEFLKSVELSVAGQEPSLRPAWWQSYELSLPQLLQRARPLAALLNARPDQKDVLENVIRKAELREADLLWLPLTSARTMEWVVLIDKQTGLPKGYAPIDGFF